MAEKILKSFRSDLRLGNPLDIDPNIGSFLKSDNLLPEVEKSLQDQGYEVPTIRHELEYLTHLQRKHNGISKAAGSGIERVAGLRDSAEFQQSFFNLKNTQARWYVKHLKLYQENPSNKNVHNSLLAGIQVNRYVPLDSLRPSLAAGEAGQRYMTIEPSHVIPEASSATGNRIPYDLAKYPAQIKNKEGRLGWAYKKLTPDNTKFFQSMNEVDSVSQPFSDLYFDRGKLDLRAIIQERNRELRKSSTKGKEGDKLAVEFDENMIPARSTGGLLARVIDNSEELDNEMPNSEVFIVGDQGVDLEINVRNLKFDLFRQEEAKLKAGIEDLTQAAHAEATDGYWAQLIPDAADREYGPLKRWVEQDLNRLRWENMPEEQGNKLKKFVGSIAQLDDYSAIPTDADGNWVPNPGIHAAPNPHVVAMVQNFLERQQNQFGDEEDIDWNTGLPEDASEDNNIKREDNIRRQWRTKSVALKQTMQRMMKAGGQDWPPYDSVGAYELNNPAHVGGVMRELELLQEADKYESGLGMEGALPEEYDYLFHEMAQLLEIKNEAALRGIDLDSWQKTAGKTFEHRDRIWGYNFKRRNKFDEPKIKNDVRNWGQEYVHKDMTKLDRMAGSDPSYTFISNAMQDLERIVVIAGNKGEKMVPMLDWSGLQVAGGARQQILMPTRIRRIRLVGTDYSRERTFPPLIKDSVLASWQFNGTPLKEFKLQSKMAEGKTTTITKFDPKAVETIKKDYSSTPTKEDTKSSPTPPGKPKQPALPSQLSDTKSTDPTTGKVVVKKPARGKPKKDTSIGGNKKKRKK